MPVENYLLYVLIATGYIASPGPAVFVAINGGFAIGTKRTLALLAGNSVGLGALAFVSALGIGAFVLNSATLTAAMKILGALWLAYLGLKMLRPQHAANPAADQSRLRKKYLGAPWLSKFFDGLTLALTNPKPIVFFVSIYPQFVVGDGAATAQFLLMGVTFVLLSFGILNVYSLLSAVIASRFLRADKIKAVNGFFGGMLIVLAVLLLADALRLSQAR